MKASNRIRSSYRAGNLSTVCATLSLLIGAASCTGAGLRCNAAREPRVAPVAAPVALEPVKLAPRVDATSPQRLLLDQRTLTQLRRSAELRTPAFVAARARADEAMSKPLASGYQGFEWADALASTALLWHATGDERYAQTSMRYLDALLDDRLALGDGQGGEKVVTHDSGYGMRTFGAYSALAYDWLRGAPGMTDAVRERIRRRLSQWLGWYAEHGYLRDQPFANYYWGYLTTLSFAGLAAAGDGVEADEWLKAAQNELSKRVLPAFRDRLRGGGWPEGWQYGEYTTLEIAMVCRAFGMAGVDVVPKVPWLGQTVTHHVHALLPDGKSVYDGGTWGERPTKPSGLGMAALSIALEGVDEARAAEARWMSTHALPPLAREQAWVGLLADRPGGSERSPREAQQLSLHLPGQGLTFTRSDWSPAAVWASFQAGPPLAEDHQDADQGHFELVRGADALLVDGGGSEGSATINHNTLLIDDHGDAMNYTPNQGVWGTEVKTTRFGDDGVVTVAVGEIGDAYSPKCALSGCDKRAVEKLTRSFVFVRPSLLVVDDRLVLTNPAYGATWAAHVTRSPEIDGARLAVVIGGSRLDLETVEPAQVGPRAVREPTPSGDGSHRLNQPWGPMWRIETTSPPGQRERRFLHAMVASATDAAKPTQVRVSGKGLRGVFSRVQDRAIAVLFADGGGPAEARLPGAANVVVVAGLTPGARYRVQPDDSACTLRLAPSRDEHDPAATSGGFVRTTLACRVP
jgi:hypothetical protein